ncbi:MAG: hypothetical protein FWD12_12790 [Alphaproteobacteria bacterium]|nr:hypothetical protein [Alphaproteobacteria bacterium]
MSDIPADSLDLREQITRIDRAIEVTRKFTAEQHKLQAEARKPERERMWFPWLQLLTLAASSAAIGAVVARLLH